MFEGTQVRCGLLDLIDDNLRPALRTKATRSQNMAERCKEKACRIRDSNRMAMDEIAGLLLYATKEELG